MVKQARAKAGLETLLVATDGSRFSKTAVREAIRIARACSGTLYVLRVLETGAEPDFWDADSEKDLVREIKNYLDGVQAEAAGAGVACVTVLRRGGEPFKVILGEARKRGVDAIVMGSHGHNGFRRLLTGSVVSKVVGRATCKVLVVPAKNRR